MFSPKPLRGNFKDYAPHIDPAIMDLHYSKHYFGYLNNLNKALEKYPEFFKMSIPQILSKISEIPEDIKEIVRNNGGGASNHEILWETISTTKTEVIEGKLKEDIEKSFGSWEKFKNLFFESSNKHFGSGWVWLVSNKNKELKVYSTPNQDSPYMMGDFPIFGVDIWEHAYYLQHKNAKNSYLEEIWKIIDWKEVEKRYLTIEN